MAETANGPGHAEASITVADEKIIISKEFGDTIDEMLNLYGEEVVHGHALIGMKTQMRNKAYSYASGEGATVEGLEALVDAHTPTKPALGGAKKTPVEKLAARLAALSEEDRSALLAVIT